MAARGAVAKEQITNQILANFNGAFKYDKEIRIPLEENGEIIQIKITLTAAKTNVDMGGDTIIPGSGADIIKGMEQAVVGEVSRATTISTEPTAEEKETVKNLMSSLGF